MRIFILDKSYCGESLYTLRKREINYLINVLRLQDNDFFTAQDVKGNYYEAVLNGETLSLSPTEDPEKTALDHFSGFDGEFVKINIFQALCKGKKNELISRMLTEAGVQQISFMQTEFCQEKELKAHDKERIETIIKEAVQQSGARSVPSLVFYSSFREALKNAKGKKIILHQSVLSSTKSLNEAIKGETEISLFIGSEGGFSEDECKAVEKVGGDAVLLKTNILRAETAGIYTVGAIQTILN